MTQPQPTIWALILSRQGSQRLPGKALAPLADRPMITYTFDAALAAPSLSRRWVFSDDPQVLDLARAAKMDIPAFDRPNHLSTSEADTFETVRHFLQQFERGDLPDWLLLLQPTSPLRTADDIEAALTWFGLHQPCDYLVSVHRPLKPPHWTYAMDPECGLTKVLAKQDGYVFPNGALYLFSPSLLLDGEQALPPEDRPGVVVKGYEMPWERSLDVDWPVDLALAEWLLSQQKPRPVTPAPPRRVEVKPHNPHPQRVPQAQSRGSLT